MELDKISLLVGLIGAYLGYIGAAKGAKKSFELNLLEKKRENLKLLNNQIKYSIKNIKSLKNLSDRVIYTEKIYFNFNAIIYNDKWSEQIAQLDNFNETEIEDIILWFMSIKSAGILSEKKDGLFQVEIQALLSDRALDIKKMTDITEKINRFI